VDQALSVEVGAGVFFDALVGIVGGENAIRFARKFATLEKVFANDVLGYEALAMFVYTTPMPWHEQINKALWQRLPNKGVLTFADALNSALTKIPPYGGVAYRGFTADNLDAFSKRYRRGHPIRMLGFTSASISPDKAFNGNVLFTIRSHTGGILWMWAADYGETDEVVFPSGSLFNVISVERHEDKAFVALEEVRT
jgi:NAD:arginine ADP-ribosyltransferase